MTGNREPVKNPLDPLVTGYPKLAGYMEVLPEIAIFRRFGALNARNLLYLQSELCTIERMLINQEKVDSVKGGNQGKYALDWFWLSQSEKDGDTAQLELVIKMRQTLKEYSMLSTHPCLSSITKICDRRGLDSANDDSKS